MPPKESNEEAMLRLMAGRGKGERQPHHGGGKGGKGYGKGKDFSSDQVPEERRAKLFSKLSEPVSLNFIEVAVAVRTSPLKEQRAGKRIGERLQGRPHHGGGKGGKGYGKGKDFSSDQVPEERRAKLCERLQTFLESEDRQLEMPPSITGLERKFLHEQADLHGLTTQSFGQGRERYIVIFKQEKASEETAVEPGYVSEIAQANYTGVFLDQQSRESLWNFCANSVPGGIPHRWTRFCDHMTICVGALSNPKTEDFRSVADTVQKQIAKYREHQEFELKVVSVGRDDHVLAVGVIGCASCNRNPHITVATAPGHPPNISNGIKKWTMIAAEEQLTLTGVVKQHGARKKAGDWDGRRFRLRCHSEQDNVLTPEENSWFGLRQSNRHRHPAQRNPIRLGFTADEAVRLTFHQVGMTAGGETLNPGTLRPGVVMDATAQMPVYALEGPDQQWVREVDDGPGPSYYLSGDIYERTHFAFLPLEVSARMAYHHGHSIGLTCTLDMDAASRKDLRSV
ncbi:hypothetical protein AK812_SmicGene2842 [Symbiodinium microadriaticum]|uniref:R3H domain-containing protein n=1 Tax=Symbiodinium microadriaticum TaxID=2951 RepID=A0A1Q9F067_SYMMI|nr:hypothetical protein AK812_SmicGene2842 [Symbiodinium microadriaticum]